MTLYKTSIVPLYRLHSGGHTGSEPTTARVGDVEHLQSGSI